MTWQLIETAPKDGSGVLIFSASYPGEIHAAVWSGQRRAWCLWGCETLSFMFDDDDAPTHWMPLPEPPK